MKLLEALLILTVTESDPIVAELLFNDIEEARGIVVNVTDALPLPLLTVYVPAVTLFENEKLIFTLAVPSLLWFTVHVRLPSSVLALILADLFVVTSVPLMVQHQ